VARKIITILLVAVFAIGGLVACKGSAQPATYKIGVASAQSGIYTGLGLQCMEGVQLIADKVNEGGGINGVPLEIIACDDKSEATEVAKVATKLAEVDEVHVIIAGTVTALSCVMVPLANEAEVPAVILSGTALLDDKLGAWVFRPMGAEWDYAIINFDYLHNRLGVSKFAALIENSGYGQGGKVFLPKLSSDFDMTIVETQYFDPGGTDLSPQLTHIKNSEAEAIFIWGSSPTAAMAVKQIREMGMSLPIATTPTQSTPNMVAEFGQYYEMEPSIIGLTTTIDVWEQLPDDDPDKAKFCEFGELYMEKCGHRLTMWNVLGAQMTLFIEDSLRRAEADPRDVVETRSRLRDAMESTTDLDLYTDIFTMSPKDHYGGKNQKLTTITFKEGEKVLLK